MFIRPYYPSRINTPRPKEARGCLHKIKNPRSPKRLGKRGLGWEYLCERDSSETSRREAADVADSPTAHRVGAALVAALACRPLRQAAVRRLAPKKKAYFFRTLSVVVPCSLVAWSR